MLTVAPPALKAKIPRNHKDHTAILDSGASGFYFSKHAPKIKFDPTAPKITMGTASGQPHQFSGASDLCLPNLSPDFPRAVKFMPFFQHTLIGLALICDANCKVTFRKTTSSNMTKEDHRYSRGGGKGMGLASGA